jgi:hypothetical protein
MITALITDTITKHWHVQSKWSNPCGASRLFTNRQWRFRKPAIIHTQLRWVVNKHVFGIDRKTPYLANPASDYIQVFDRSTIELMLSGFSREHVYWGYVYPPGDVWDGVLHGPTGANWWFRGMHVSENDIWQWVIVFSRTNFFLW